MKVYVCENSFQLSFSQKIDLHSIKGFLSIYKHQRYDFKYTFSFFSSSNLRKLMLISRENKLLKHRKLVHYSENLYLWQRIWRWVRFGWTRLHMNSFLSKLIQILTFFFIKFDIYFYKLLFLI